MAILIHECTGCGHAQKDHGSFDPHARGYTTCVCCRSNAAPPFNPEPTVRETFDIATGKPEPLYPPGSVRNRGNKHREVLCDCMACLNAVDNRA